jgi:hypothetical protein
MAQVDPEDSTAAPKGPADALYFSTDISPEELFEALGKLRREAHDEIERLIDLLDRTDDFFDEREQQVDDDPIDGDDGSEDSLGSTVDDNQTRWAAGYAGDREGDGCADDREETCEDEGAEHDGREPSLGWTEEEASRAAHLPARWGATITSSRRQRSPRPPWRAMSSSTAMS